MKIAVLGTRGFPGIQGGVEAHCENLYPRLAARGCEVIVFTRKPYVRRPDVVFKGVRLIPLTCPKHKTLEAFVHTLKGVLAARRLKPDIIHIHAIGPSLLVPLARLLGFKVIITTQGQDYNRQKWGIVAKTVLKFGEYLGCVFAHEVIAVSDAIAGDIHKKYGRDPVVIPNGVVIPGILTTGGALTRFELTSGKYLLGVARLVPEKGFHDLVEAFADFQSESRDPAHREWKLVLVGKADHEDQYSRGLRKKAAENRNIVLAGYLEGVPLRELFSHAGLFVLPSYHEGLSIAYLEAMSHGLPCIAGDIPANRNAGMTDNVFFRPGDVRELKEKIANAVGRPMTPSERAERISRIARIYDWDIIADKTLAVYRKVLS